MIHIKLKPAMQICAIIMCTVIIITVTVFFTPKKTAHGLYRGNGGKTVISVNGGQLRSVLGCGDTVFPAEQNLYQAVVSDYCSIPNVIYGENGDLTLYASGNKDTERWLWCRIVEPWRFITGKKYIISLEVYNASDDANIYIVLEPWQDTSLYYERVGGGDMYGQYLVNSIKYQWVRMWGIFTASTENWILLYPCPGGYGFTSGYQIFRNIYVVPLDTLAY